MGGERIWGTLWTAQAPVAQDEHPFDNHSTAARYAISMTRKQCATVVAMIFVHFLSDLGSPGTGASRSLFGSE